MKQSQYLIASRKFKKKAILLTFLRKILYIGLDFVKHVVVFLCVRSKVTANHPIQMHLTQSDSNQPFVFHIQFGIYFPKSAFCQF